MKGAAPYIQDSDLTLYQGDALEVLRELPDESVHMCVTSPPFFGLRDYGTGVWVGGDADCYHPVRPDAKVESSTLTGGKATTGHQREGFRAVCPRCGARRIDQQIGLEESPEQWVSRLVEVFREVRRVLRKDGTCWVEIGDSYAGSWGAQGHRETPATISRNQIKNHPKRASHTGTIRQAGLKPKDLIGAPWMLAFALRADGWYLRSDIVWARPNPMPESVTDRPTKSHSYLFLLAKSPRYFYDAEAVREESIYPAGHTVTIPDNGKSADTVAEQGIRTRIVGEHVMAGGRNKRSVWTIATEPLPDAHYAAFPQKLVEPCILAGTSEQGVCPECGAPWVRVVEKERVFDHGPSATENHTPRNDAGGGDDVRRGPRVSVLTTGWKPSCDHDLAPIPATCLDPFFGSGTTGLVARRLGRKCIGVELSPTYCELAARRLQQLSLLAETA